MKTNKVFAYGIVAVIIALAFIGCPEPEPVHKHSYSAEWSHNATQHWRECSCGAKTDVANHSGDPCAVCEYTVSNPEPTCECNGKAEDCDCDDCDCETCETKIPAVAHAQAEPTHTLASNLTITLNGTDSAGNITVYAWECESYTADQGAVSAEYTT